MKSSQNIPATIAICLRAAHHTITNELPANGERIVDAIDSILTAAEQLETLAQLPGSDTSGEGPSTARPDDQQNAGDGVASTVLPLGIGKGVTSAGGESGLPLRMLDWVMEHTDAGYRVGTVCGVHWLDPRDGRGFLTRGKTYEDAITLASSECAAIEDGVMAMAGDKASEGAAGVNSGD